MVDLSTWLIFVGIAFITGLTPGPGVLLVVSSTIAFGTRAAILCSAGNAIGLFIVSAATMVGLGALLKSSAVLFAIVKVLGAGYLIYLGISQWKSRASIWAQSGHPLTSERQSNSACLLRGLLLAATNPKAILFFTALLPQFIEPERSMLVQFFVLTGTFLSAAIVSHVAYIVLAHHAKSWLSAEYRVKLLNRVFGGVYMLLGVSMLRLKDNSS